MGDAGIQDISKQSDLPKVLLKVEQKFRLDLTDEQAEQFFLGLINESCECSYSIYCDRQKTYFSLILLYLNITVHAVAPRIMDVAHSVAVSMR